MKRLKLFENFNTDYQQLSLTGKSKFEDTYQPEEFKVPELREILIHLGMQSIYTDLGSQETVALDENDNEIMVKYGLADWSQLKIYLIESDITIKVFKKQDGYFLVQKGTKDKNSTFWECDGMNGVKECLMSLIWG